MGITTDIWSKQPGKYFCVSTKDPVTGVWKDQFFTRDQFSAAERFIATSHKRLNVYACPHGFTRPRRRKEVAVPPRILYADLDAVDPKLLPYQPSILIQSSPGRYVGYWVVDEPITEELNRRMTHAVGADKGGFDFTQVLRIPETTNHKYSDKPRVQLIRKSAKVFKIQELSRQLPQVAATADYKPNSLIGLIEEYQLPRSLRRKIMSRPTISSDRSEVLWSIINDLVEEGLAFEEIVEVATACQWNKFSNHRDGGVDTISKQVHKALNGHVSRPKPRTKPDEDDDSLPATISIGSIKSRAVDWIVPSIIARGELTLLSGDPSVGKSMVATALISGLLSGDKQHFMPSALPTKPGKVLYIDLENAVDTTIRPRLEARGLETSSLNRAFAMKPEETTTLFDEEFVEKLEEAIKYHKPDLFIVDTIGNVLGGDANKAEDVLEVMNLLSRFATEYNMAGLLIRHMGKSSQGKSAVHRGHGSVAFTGRVRIELQAYQHPKEPNQAILVGSKNSHGPRLDAWAYTIGNGRPVLADNGKRLTDIGVVRWLGKLDMSLEEIANGQLKDKDKEESLEERFKRLTTDPVRPSTIIAKMTQPQRGGRFTQEEVMAHVESMHFSMKDQSWKWYDMDAFRQWLSEQTVSGETIVVAALKKSAPFVVPDLAWRELLKEIGQYIAPNKVKIR